MMDGKTSKRTNIAQEISKVGLYLYKDQDFTSRGNDATKIRENNKQKDAYCTARAINFRK